MKKSLYFIIVTLLSISVIKAQTTGGADFWLTFGNNYWGNTSGLDFQIRIVGGDSHTEGTIYFTALGTSAPFSLSPYEVYTLQLSPTQRAAVYNTTQGKSNKSIHITTNDNKAVTVYALNQASASTDATNILPITVLDTAYYQISYRPITSGSDAYAVIATENNTNIYHNGDFVETLNAGEVYYKTSSTDMTGARINSTFNKPVAFFALNQAAYIPYGVSNYDCLFQQLAPVNTWGKNFFVPTSHLGKDRVRIVVAENNTTISLIGGTLKTDVMYAQDHLNNLMAGQFVEIEVTLAEKGCSISADKRIGVCTYLTGIDYNGWGVSDPSQAWLPAIEQTTPNALIAPFMPTGTSYLNAHYALVMMPTEAKINAKVSIGGGPPGTLTGTWYDNDDAGMSFCIMQLTNTTASYYFTNEAELIVMGYGVGNTESYYYLGYSAMRNLSAAFSANGVPYTKMADSLFCENEITFTTVITGASEMDSIKWYKQKTSGNTPDLDYVLITDIVEDPPLEWTRTFRAGNYMIKLEVYHNGELEPLVYEGELCVGAHITIYPTPNDGGMTKPTTGCYKVGTQLPMEAYPY